MNELLDQLFIVAYRTTQDKEKAKDLAQDLYLKIHDKRKSFEKAQRDGRALNWLYRVARNKVIDDHRKRREFEIIERDFVEEPLCQPIDFYEILREAKKILTEIDYLWLYTYLNNDCNYSEIERNFEISRQSASIEINRIIKIIQDAK